MWRRAGGRDQAGLGAATGALGYAAGVPLYDGGDPTKWQVWAVTDHAIACVELEFAASAYTISDEDNDFRCSNPPSCVVLQAWARSLRQVTGLAVGHVGPLNAQNWFSIDAIKLTFDNREVVEIPAQRTSDPVSRDRSDSFIAAIREALAF